jgi:hypothetical protein
VVQLHIPPPSVDVTPLLLPPDDAVPEDDPLAPEDAPPLELPLASVSFELDVVDPPHAATSARPAKEVKMAARVFILRSSPVKVSPRR